MGAANAALNAKPSYSNKGVNNAANSGLMSVCPYVVSGTIQESLIPLS